MKIISLGVGVQSSALYYMSSIGEIEQCDYAIFAGTGGEKTKTIEYYELLLLWAKANNGIELHKAKLYTNLALPICLLISTACSFVGFNLYLKAFNII